MRYKKHKKNKGCRIQEDTWCNIEEIITTINIWTLLIAYYTPQLIETGISTKDIKKHFKEIIEAHIGEQLQ